MKLKRRTLQLGALMLLSTSIIACSTEGNDDDDDQVAQAVSDTLSKDGTTNAQNGETSDPRNNRQFSSTGVSNTPVGDSEAGPASSGKTYEFEFLAKPGDYLSFATMYVQSNDLFYAPKPGGIALFDGSGNPVTGDVTSQVMLWDAGTEVNQEPGSGADQAPRQSGPNTGDAENGVVRLVDDGFSYPNVDDIVEVTLSYVNQRFVVQIKNVGDSSQSPIAPVAWAIHSKGVAFFQAGTADYSEGLEALAEDGDPSSLLSSAKKLTDDTYTTFKLSIENALPSPDFRSSGVFNTPVGADSAGLAGKGASYQFSVAAAPGDKLSFATMFVQSNDLFYAPDGSGIALYDSSNNPVTGDVTAQVKLWDAGTEVNETLGEGANQAPRQSVPNTGDAENGNVVEITDFTSTPTVTDTIQVSIANSGTTFTVTIENLSNGSLETPLAAGVYVVHTTDNPLFTSGSPDAGEGLEGLAEDGTVDTLSTALAAKSGFGSPFAPGVFAIHTGDNPLFTSGSSDAGEGLEALAEDGDPSTLQSSAESKSEVRKAGVYNTPDDATSAGPIASGKAYSTLFKAKSGDKLSTALMLVQSNDLFVATGAEGLALFDSAGDAISGDQTASFQLWDAGTEVDETPGVGPNQAPRQSDPNTGDAENGNVVVETSSLSDLSISNLVKVTLTPVE